MDPEPPAPEVWVGVLGPLVLRVAGVEVRVPGTRRRALLATLALARGRAVGVDRLVDALWPDDPPEDAAQALYSHVSRLRRDLGSAGGRLARQGAGYVLELAEDELDATVVRAVVDGLPLLPPDRVLGRALAASELWRGPALEEFRGHSDLDVEAVALDELRMRLHDEVVQARIAVGDGSAVADASAAVAADPLRERGVLLLMQALAGEGRTAEAMAAGTTYRRRLAAETGLDPGPALGRLEQEIASGELAARDRPPAWSARRTVARPSGPLVGRQQEQDEVLRLLAGHRVVTLTGPGGVGKTRLALEVTAALAELDQVDAVVVDLAAVEDASRVVQAVVSTLGLRLVAAEQPTALDVAAALADATLLLVLDNAEHVAQSCRGLVDAVDRHATGVRVLVTSRVTLHAHSEYVVRLQPLPTPRDAQDLAALERQPSVRAFLEHARRRDSSYELTALDAEPLVEILQHLDGLPLAIELVAGQVAMLPLAAVRDRLGRALDLVTGADGHEEDRQRTLRLTIRWSYDRLTSAQQTLLRAVAAFPGGVDLATVEELAGEVEPEHDPVRLLQGLADASLLDVDPGRTRYRLLFTVRAFLLEEVAALGELAATEDRFLRWAVRAAEEIGAGLRSRAEAHADRRLRAELDNLRAARDLARAGGLMEPRVRITLAFDQPAVWRDLREQWSWCLELAHAPETDGHPREVEIRGAGAEAARQAGDYDHAVELARHGLAVAGEPGPTPGRRRAAGLPWPASRTTAATSPPPPVTGRGPHAPPAPRRRGCSPARLSPLDTAVTGHMPPRSWPRHASTSRPAPTAATTPSSPTSRGSWTPSTIPRRPLRRTSPPSRRHAASAPTSWRAWPGSRWPPPGRGPVTRPPRPRRTATCWTTGAPPDTGPSCGPRPATRPRCSSPRATRGRRRCCSSAPTPPRKPRPSTPTSRDTAVAASSRSPRWSPPTSWSRCELRRPR